LEGIPLVTGSNDRRIAAFYLAHQGTAQACYLAGDVEEACDLDPVTGLEGVFGCQSDPDPTGAFLQVTEVALLTIRDRALSAAAVQGPAGHRKTVDLAQRYLGGGVDTWAIGFGRKNDVEVLLPLDQDERAEGLRTAVGAAADQPADAHLGIDQSAGIDGEMPEPRHEVARVGVDAQQPAVLHVGGGRLHHAADFHPFGDCGTGKQASHRDLFGRGEFRLPQQLEVDGDNVGFEGAPFQHALQLDFGADTNGLQHAGSAAPLALISRQSGLHEDASRAVVDGKHRRFARAIGPGGHNPSDPEWLQPGDLFRRDHAQVRDAGERHRTLCLRPDHRLCQ
jgi:hypothetical protein